MPWCEECSRFWNPPSMNRDGSCPSCGRVIAEPAKVPATANSPPNANSNSSTSDEETGFTKAIAVGQDAWLWLVEPLQRTVEVYRLEAGAWGVAGTHGGAETARITPFEVVDVDMRRWWVEA